MVLGDRAKPGLPICLNSLGLLKVGPLNRLMNKTKPLFQRLGLLVPVPSFTFCGKCYWVTRRCAEAMSVKQDVQQTGSVDRQ